jgi:hypothetical protein
LGRVHNRKDSTTTTETNTSRPTHRVFAVTKNRKKKFWQPIGALWAHADGKGFNLTLGDQPQDEGDERTE